MFTGVETPPSVVAGAVLKDILEAYQEAEARRRAKAAEEEKKLVCVCVCVFLVVLYGWRGSCGVREH